MASSLFTGVTGLRIHQQMLDVVGNDLANANTTGFKAQTVRFTDLVYQTFAPASAATSTTGGTNPVQVGLGARVGSIASDMQQGAITSTGRDLDMALEGPGYFVARNGTESLYTRAGTFGVDSQNYMVDPSTGYRVQRFGSVGEGTATTPAFQTSGNDDIKIPIGTGIPGNVTSNIVMQGNLSANAVGPQAQLLTSAQPFLAGGSPVTGVSTLDSLDDNLAPYGATDLLTIQGTTAANVPVTTSLPVTGATTMDDIINAINANFPGSVASLDASGNIVLTSSTTGATNLNLTITDDAANAGGTTWGNHILGVTTTGKDGDTVKSGIQAFDSQGTAHNLDMVFTKQANNTWDMTVQINPAEGTILDNLVSNINFNEDGSFAQVSGTGLGDGMISVQFNGFAAPQQIGFNLGAFNAFDGLTQFGGPSSAAATSQDGYAAGFLTTLAVEHDGTVNGVFTNGRTLALAQIAVATFANAGALNRVGDNYFALSTESGPPLVGAGLAGGRGAVQQKALENSNVDVALEFTRLIIAQRGFQVNAKVITASDQILQDLANIIR